MTTTTQISGLAELHKLLQTLPAKVEGRVMRGALRAGQRVIQAEVKGRVPVESGALRESIKIKFRPRSQKYGWVRLHLTAGDKNAFYAHFLEYGTASYYTGTGKTVGKPYKIEAKDGELLHLQGNKFAPEVTHPGVKPQAFMRPGFDAAQQPALDAVVGYIRRRLPKEILKNAAPGND
jgi:HK97 gp10 family phage protein